MMRIKPPLVSTVTLAERIGVEVDRSLDCSCVSGRAVSAPPKAAVVMVLIPTPLTVMSKRNRRGRSRGCKGRRREGADNLAASVVASDR